MDANDDLLVTLVLSAVGGLAPSLVQLLLGVVGTSVLATGGATHLMLAVNSRLRSMRMLTAETLLLRWKPARALDSPMERLVSMKA